MDGLWIIASIALLICAVGASHIAEQRQAGTEGFFFGLFFGPLGVIAAGFLDRRPRCPRCGGRINHHEATTFYSLCEHCGVDLPQVPQESSHEKWRLALSNAKARLAGAMGVDHFIDSE